MARRSMGWMGLAALILASCAKPDPRPRIETPTEPPRIITVVVTATSPPPTATPEAQSLSVPGQSAQTRMELQEAFGAFALAPDGSMFAVGGEDFVLLGSIDPPSLVHTITTIGHTVTALAFSESSRLLAAGFEDGGIVIYDAETGTEVQKIEYNRDPVTALAWSKDSEFLVTGTTTKLIGWRVLDPTEAFSYSQESGSITALSFAPDGLEFVTSARSGVIDVWSQRGGYPMRMLGTFKEEVTSAAWEPNYGKVIATGMQSGRVILWSTADFQPKRFFDAYHSPVTALAWWPDTNNPLTGKSYLITGGEDGRVIWWDMVDMENVTPLATHDAAVIGVGYTQGKVISASEEGVVIVSIAPEE